MKKLITLFILAWTFGTAFAQLAPPQAVCYQAVATDADGRELMGANISIRTSIIENSPSGALIYQENFSPVQTDDFGLFNINLGEGNQTGGSAAGFSDITWGIDNYFLKVEIDVVGGNNFVDMGTSQILSVPYALYAGDASFAENAATATTAQTAATAQTAMFADSAAVAATAADDFDKDATNEIQELTYDGTTLSLSGPGSGSSVTFNDFPFRAQGASFDYPQGILGQHVALTMGMFTVPQGANFYLTGSEQSINISNPTINNGELLEHSPTPNMPVFPSGTTLTNCRCTGFLVPQDGFVESVLIDISDDAASYEVPAGKVLFIKSGFMNDSAGYLSVDGVDIEFFRPNLSRWTRIVSLPAGTTIRKPSSPAGMDKFVLTGFLIEE